MVTCLMMFAIRRRQLINGHSDSFMHYIVPLLWQNWRSRPALAPFATGMPEGFRLLVPVEVSFKWPRI
jgi:hypothetical protein